MPTRQGGSFFEKSQDVPPLQLPADDQQTVGIHAVNLKNRLGDIETYRRNRLHGLLLQWLGDINSAHIFGTLVPVAA